MIATTSHPYYVLFQREIERFQSFAQLRCTEDRLSFRRRHKRYHRSWPLMITSCHLDRPLEQSAALNDASESGIGFMCESRIELDELIFIKLFWHDSNALRIPAIVRHVSSVPHGLLIGAEYTLLDSKICEKALMMDQPWNL